jgi:hypothetical protein
MSWGHNILNCFLSGLQKLEQRAKSCIELRWEYVEQIPNLVAVASFLPGQTKYLSALSHTYNFNRRQYEENKVVKRMISQTLGQHDMQIHIGIIT